MTSLLTSFIERGRKVTITFLLEEPSSLYISRDGGKSWQIKNNFINLKSSSSWSFPPRPWTHHVRWIESDKNKDGYLFVAIEARGLI